MLDQRFGPQRMSESALATRSNYAISIVPACSAEEKQSRNKQRLGIAKLRKLYMDQEIGSYTMLFLFQFTFQINDSFVTD